MNISTIPTNQIWTHKQVLTQDVANGLTPFNSSSFYQDFTVVGLPANHMIVGVKIVTLVSFVAGSDVDTHVYLGASSTVGTPNTGAGTLNVTTANLFGHLSLAPLLNSPSSPDSSYSYGSFRWFMVAAPGSVVNRSGYSDSKCLPVTFSAHDIVARFTVTNSGGSVPAINQITSGSVEITIQYSAI